MSYVCIGCCMIVCVCKWNNGCCVCLLEWKYGYPVCVRVDVVFVGAE